MNISEHVPVVSTSASCAGKRKRCGRRGGRNTSRSDKEIFSQVPEVTPDLASRIHALRGGGKPLPDATRAFFEPRFGSDFSHVRVHADARAAAAARAVNARAFTVGPDIVFGGAQYAPGTTEGRQLLAHELTHVVQQFNPSHI
jgi:hypothetical protein